MRVIGGALRGRRLTVPRRGVRPTSDRVRESLFATLGDVSDALVLSSAVDAAILVCRANVNSRGLVQRARDRLYHGNARIIGAVLNGVQVRRGGYFREQYRAFYDYQADDRPAIEAPRAVGATPKDKA